MGASPPGTAGVSPASRSWAEGPALFGRWDTMAGRCDSWKAGPAGRWRSQGAQLGSPCPNGAGNPSRKLLLPDQPPQRLLVRRQQLGHPRVVDVGDDDLADFLVDLAEDAVGFHL